jgi:hypothetical protein
MAFLDEPDQGFRPYWVFTGSDDVLRSLVLEKGHAMTREIEALIRGESVTHVVSEHVVLRELDTNADAVWSLLLMSGYLTARSTELRDGEMHAELAIPNREVAHVFRTAVSAWLQASLQGGRDAVHELARAMLEGEADLFEELLSELVLTSPSYHATARDTPERVYQAFVLGMLVHLQPGYAVRSEQESGLGRYDLAVMPNQAGKPGVILEFKRLRTLQSETVPQALESALAQIRTRRYEATLQAQGANPIHAYGVVFDGKRVWVKKGA